VKRYKKARTVRLGRERTLKVQRTMTIVRHCRFPRVVMVTSHLHPTRNARHVLARIARMRNNQRDAVCKQLQDAKKSHHGISVMLMMSLIQRRCERYLTGVGC